MRIQISGASCNLGLTYENDPKNQHYLLTALEVDPRQRGQGLASYIIEACKTVANMDGYDIRLWAALGTTSFDQQALFEFYQRHGFYFFDATRPNWMEYRHVKVQT